MAKAPVLTDVTNLANAVSALAQFALNNERLEDAFANTLSRDGSGPNNMLADLDMDSHRLLNVADPVADLDGVNKRSVRDLVGQFAAEIAETVVLGTQVVDKFVATAGQTSRTLADAPEDVSNVFVFVNGSALIPNEEFTLSGTTPAQIAFVTPLTLADEVVIRYSSTLPIGTAKAEFVNFADSAAPVYLKTVSDLLNGEPVNVLRNIPRNRWAGIQAGTDTQDTATSIMDLMDGASTAQQAVIRFPKGNFVIHRPILRSAGSAPFRLVGDDMMRSVITRGSDWAPAVGTGSVFSISGVDGHSLENLRINANATLYPTNANHAVAASNSNNVRYRNLYVEDWKNSAILLFHSPGTPPPSSPQEVNNVIEACYMVGNGNSNNGVLLVDQQNSYIDRCVVLNLGQAGSPQYALQFKNKCYHCHILNSVAVNARAAVAFGQESVVGDATSFCSVQNVIAKDCIWGLYMGKAADCTVNGMNIDMSLTGAAPIELADSNNNAITNIRLRNQRITGGAGAPYSAKFSGASSGNIVEFSDLYIDSPTTPRIADISSTSSKNSVRVEHLNLPTTPLLHTGQAVSNANTSATAGNSVSIAGYPTQEALTISSGAITVLDAKTTLLRVNTEAAAATDDLDTITGPGIDGQTITLKSTSNSRDVTVKHGTGNIRLAGGADFTLGLIQAKITLQWDAGVSFWCEVSRSNNS